MQCGIVVWFVSFNAIHVRYVLFEMWVIKSSYINTSSFYAHDACAIRIILAYIIVTIWINTCTKLCHPQMWLEIVLVMWNNCKLVNYLILESKLLFLWQNPPPPFPSISSPSWFLQLSLRKVLSGPKLHKACALHSSK